MTLKLPLLASAARVRWDLIVPSMVIVIAATCILHYLFPGPSSNFISPAYLIAPYDELGVRVANQTATTAGPTGTVVIVNVDEVQKNSPNLSTIQQAYYQRMAELTGLRVVARVEESVDFTAVFSGTRSNPDGTKLVSVPEIPAARFLALLNQYHQADVLVLLGATPELNPEDYARLPAHRPKVICVETMGRLPQKRLFEEGVLQAAFERRLPPSSQQADTPAQWVDKLYILYTPENAANIPQF